MAIREARTDGARSSFQRAEWSLAVAISELGGCAGGLAANVPPLNKQLYARVKRAVNEVDPIGLLRAGAPHDEYHPEINEIARWLPEPQCRTIARTQWIVHRVFAKWFDYRVAGPRSTYRGLAKALHGLRHIGPRASSRKGNQR